MEWYPWLNAPYRQLVAQHQAGRGHHAVLLHALPGMGEASLAWALSRWLMCRQTDGFKSCGVCHDCRLMEAGNHPDWYSLTPEKGRHSLGVDQIREVLDKLYQRSRQGGAKVVWLPLSEQLTEAAANALLKTLEEPPENTWFLLGCREPTRLLATLRSRCLHCYLAAPDEARSIQWLNSRHPGDGTMQRTALRLHAGAPLAAESMLLPARWQQRTELCQALAAALAQQNFLPLIAQLNHDDVGERLHWLATLLVDGLKWQQHAQAFLVNQDQQALAERLATSHTADALQQAVQQWLTCRHRLLTIAGINRELLLTGQLLNWEQSLIAGAVCPAHTV
ncbi:DNA polymerase III subunit delta' [Affinibrenneria salicis]|uniref:DNA polymerase III subunit delta' n=1 Tax=Affinibrenneria salicis TaxID=2590031 RepID=A0A5J5G2T4_9GAMM|nr:DNA polymerase III subunit delta' [Affinibrenneria salicis]KAA9001207.1 DNA polymerase III subunit delta' [Affinibrenneria salicis]